MFISTSTQACNKPVWRCFKYKEQVTVFTRAARDSEVVTGKTEFYARFYAVEFKLIL